MGYYTSLALESTGNPQFSYCDQTSNTLKYAWYTAPAPTIGIGLYRPSTGTWFIDHDNPPDGAADDWVKWGMSSDIPVTGDWDNDGYDELGLYRPSMGMWFLDHSDIPDGAADDWVKWGMSSDIPVTGDWDDDGYDELGLYRP